MNRDEAGVQDTFLTHEVYKDEITMQLIAEACKLLGKWIMCVVTFQKILVSFNIGHIILLLFCFCFVWQE